MRLGSLALQCAYSLPTTGLKGFPPGTEERIDRLWLESLKVGVGRRLRPTNVLLLHTRAGIPKGPFPPELPL